MSNKIVKLQLAENWGSVHKGAFIGIPIDKIMYILSESESDTICYIALDKVASIIYVNGTLDEVIEKINKDGKK